MHRELWKIVINYLYLEYMIEAFSIWREKMDNVSREYKDKLIHFPPLDIMMDGYNIPPPSSMELRTCWWACFYHKYLNNKSMNYQGFGCGGIGYLPLPPRYHYSIGHDFDLYREFYV